MLKRIAPSDVEIGMFIHKLEGSWLKHPFWRSKFLLDDNSTLLDLRHAEIPAVIIDTSRGKDLGAPQPRSGANENDSAPQSPARAFAPPRRAPFARSAPAPFDFGSTQPATLAREFGHAQSIAKRGEKLVSKVFLNVRLGKAVDSAAIEPVISDIFASVQRNPHAFNGLMRCKRDNQFVYQHALAVSALMISLAKTLKLSPALIRDAGMAGLLLDVGIGHLPIDMAHAQGDWREVAEDLLKNHTTLGYDFLRLGGGISEQVALVALQHHERIDGTGYPHGLQGEAITELARMAALCDTYDVLVSDRAGQPGLDPASAIVIMREMHGKFDPAMLAAFEEAIGVHPVGSVVLLESGRLALVVDQDLADHRLPRVRTFYSVNERKSVTPEDIALAGCFGADRIVGSADPAHYGITDWPRQRLRIFTAACKP